MKIILIHNLYGEFSHGGAEKIVQRQIQRLQTKNQQVILITTSPNKDEVKVNSEENLKIYHLKSQLYNLSDKSVTYRLIWHLNNFIALKRYFKIKKILQKEKPNLVITHNLIGLGFFIPLILRQLSIPQKHYLHDIQLLHPSGLLMWNQENKINSFGSKIYQTLTRSLFASPQTIVSPSQWLLKLHHQHRFFPQSKTMIERFNLAKQTTSIISKNKTIKEKRKINFIFVGQIEYHKGIIFLIKTWQRIRNNNVKLKIIGRGKELKAAKNLAKNDQRIIFLGQLNYPQVQTEMEQSDYLIVPSLCYENSPTVIYEAKAVGLKIIAAKIGGITEISEEQDKLFSAGNTQELQTIIENLI